MRALNSRNVASLLAILGCVASLPSAHAQSAQADATVETCAQAYTAGQEARLKGDRLQAIERFSVCSAASCPSVVVQDCSRWLREVQAELASVRFVAQDPKGARLSSVDVYLGDEMVTLGNDGTALVPPGKQEFRFEAPDYQPARVERSLAVGERDVVIVAVLTPVASSRPSEPTTHETEATVSEQPPKQASSGGVPVASIVLGSIGVVSLAVGTGFGLSARSKYHELESTCHSDCPAEEADVVSQRALIADIALATGAITLGAALFIYFQRDDSSSVAVGIAPGPGGAQGRLRASF